MPKISVIIPTHNRPQFLKRALESVCCQTLMPTEILVVQNGPDNGAQEVCESFANNGFPVRYFSESHAGAARARNRGIREAQGDTIAFLDDDDEWLPEKLSKQIHFMEEFPSIGVISCLSYEIDAQGELRRLRPERNRHIELKTLVLEDTVNLISSLSGVVIRRNCFEKAGLFNESYRIGDDADLYIRLAQYFVFYSLPEPLFRYHLHENNASRRLEEGWLEMISILSRMRPNPEYGLTPELLREGIVRLNGYFYRDGVDRMSEGNYGRALKKFSRAVTQDPMIGLKIKWSRYRNPVYRFMKPYMATMYCGMKMIGGGNRG